MISPAELARRVAAGIGLAQVRELETLLESVSTSATENAELARHLERQVGDLEAALVPILRARSARPVQPVDSSSPAT